MISIFLFTAPAMGSKLSSYEMCLKQSDQSTSDCLKKYVKNINLESCYSSLQSVRSQNAQEKIKNFCFYQISDFPNLKNCVTKATKFYEAENKDHALFECYLQFSQSISKSSCRQIADHMIYPDKKNHMNNICEML